MGYTPQPISKFIPLNNMPDDIQVVLKSFEDRWLSQHIFEGDLTLYHYTTPEGLLGIIKNRSIRSTNINFLNDPLELQYGRKFIFNILKKYSESEKDTTIKKIIERLYDFDDAYKYLYPTYITCFSEKYDLLNQWILYSKQGNGYNLGFSFDSNEPVTRYFRESQKSERPIILRKVIYNPEEQICIINEFISKIFLGIRKSIEKRETSVSELAEQIAMKIYNYFIEIMISMKSPSFEEEQEWRFIDIVFKHEDQPNFKIDNNRATPYHDTHYYKEKNGNDEFTLESIRIGPMLEKTKTIKSLEAFLDGMRKLSHPIRIMKEIKLSKSSFGPD